MERNTANKILDTATSLFAAFGFEKVTIKQLAQAAIAILLLFPITSVAKQIFIRKS